LQSDRKSFLVFLYRIKQILEDSQGNLIDRLEAYFQEFNDKRLEAKLKQLYQWRLQTLED
jgi:hypothetical protein